MPPSNTFTKLTCGMNHCCSLDSAGGAWCWGKGTENQLGTGVAEDAPEPVQIPAAPSGAWIDISAGWRYTCAVDSAGVVYCWGDGGEHIGMGDWGYGITTPTPIIATGAIFRSVRASLYNDPFTCALDSEGESWCWGYNWDGQLGNGTETNSGTPVRSYSAPEPYLPGSLSTGMNHTCALTIHNKPYCFGGNNMGSAGLGLLEKIAIPMATLPPQ